MSEAAVGRGEALREVARSVRALSVDLRETTSAPHVAFARRLSRVAEGLMALAKVEAGTAPPGSEVPFLRRAVDPPGPVVDSVSALLWEGTLAGMEEVVQRARARRVVEAKEVHRGR